MKRCCALQGCKKYGIILAFDVPVTREAQELADKEGVRIMRADIIYHLFDQFTAYCKEVRLTPEVPESEVQRQWSVVLEQ